MQKMFETKDGKRVAIVDFARGNITYFATLDTDNTE
jgi:hypothetical protein